MSRTHLETGRRGEQEAISFLEQKGYKLLEVNYSTPIGEIDVVARDGKTIVFVEIKTRRGHSFGLPEEAVHARKQKKIAQVAQYFLKRYRSTDQPARFDVLSVSMNGNGDCDYRLIQNAFDVPSDLG